MAHDLKILEQRWGLALRSAGFGVWDLDPGREQVSYSPEWKAMLGYAGSDEADSTDTWRSRVHPDDLQGMKDALFAHVEGSDPVYEAEFRLRAADGTYRWVLSRGQAVERDATGRALRMIGTLTDLTDRRQAEVLRAERDRAQEANRAKTEFLSRMSHELRTPLNAVLGFAQLLSAGIGSTDIEAQRHYVRHIEKAGWHLLTMIDDMLDLSRVESGQLQIRIETVALAPLLQTAAEMMGPLAQGRSVQIHLGPLPVDATVLADPGRLKQVFTNLLSNAVKYNRDGGTVSVTVDGAAHPGAWQVSVSDTGIGMSQAQVAHLFEPFNRLGLAGSAIDGVGIGLVLTRWLLDKMDAAIAVRSAAGSGSSFAVTLPAGPSRSAAPAEHSARAGVAGRQRAGENAVGFRNTLSW